MEKNEKKFDRRQIVVSCAVLVCVLLLIAGAVALASCGRSDEPPEDSGTGAGTASAQVPTGDTPASSGSAGTGSSGTQPSASTGTPSETVEPPAVDATVYYSPSSVSTADGKIYVADATKGLLTRFSSDGKAEKAANAGAAVSKVLCAGGKVYALVGESSGALQIYDADLKKEKSIAVGHTPTDLYIDGQTAYVCNRFSNTVSIVDLSQGRVVKGVEVSREPVCMAAANGILYVGSHLHDGSALESTLSSKVVLIDMSKGEAVGTIQLQDGATNLRGMASSPDGAQIYVTHTVARYTYPTSQLDRGWVNTNGFTVIDTATGKPTAFLLDDVEKGAANPWDVEVSADGLSLYFSISGTGELIRLDLAKLKNRIASLDAGRISGMTTPDEAIDHIEFLSGLKTRIALSGEGVRDLALADGKLYAAGYFSGTVEVIDASKMKTLSSFEVGNQPEMNAVRKGEALWCDATYCYQSWESCSSCHPDARPDGLNWDEGGDGRGTPKNTKSMMFSLRTPPVLMTGCMPDAESNVIGTVREAFHSTLDEELVECMNEYLRSLLPVASPHLGEDGGYSEAALRGQKVFIEAGCALCHPAPLYTDLQFHKSPYLGSDGSWEDREFVTPTLVEIWRSAPYTYSGGVTDLKELIRKFSRTALNDRDVSDLEQFLLSIGIVDEDYGVVQVFSEKDGGTYSGALRPGSIVRALTLIRQSARADLPKATVRVTLCDGSGNKLTEKTIEAPELPYGASVKLETDIEVPGTLGGGGYLLLEITDAGGNALATPLKLIYKE